MKELSIINQDKSSLTTELDISGFKIQGWNILVQPLKVVEETKGGILMPDSFKDDLNYLNNICKVLDVGPLAYTQEGFQGETWCKPGDFVLIPRNTGTKLLLKGVPVTLVACDRVLAVVDDPKSIDPNYAFSNF